MGAFGLHFYPHFFIFDGLTVEEALFEREMVAIPLLFNKLYFSFCAYGGIALHRIAIAINGIFNVPASFVVSSFDRPFALQFFGNRLFWRAGEAEKKAAVCNKMMDGFGHGFRWFWKGGIGEANSTDTQAEV